MHHHPGDVIASVGTANEGHSVSDGGGTGWASGAFWSAAVVGLGLLYSFGYWGAFAINPLEHVGLADVAKLAAYALAIGAACLACMVTLGGVVGILMGFGIGLLPERLKRTFEPLLAFLCRHRRVLQAVLVICIVLVVPALNVLYSGLVVAWLSVVGASLVALGLPLALRGLRMVDVPVPQGLLIAAHTGLGGSLFMLLTLYAGLAFPAGRLFAIAATSEAFGVRAEGAIAHGVSSDPCKPAYYLGRLGDMHAFFAESDGRVILVQASSLPVLQLESLQVAGRLKLWGERTWSRDLCVQAQTQTVQDAAQPPATPAPAPSEPPPDEPR
jgi:hypothetical protein